MRHVILTHRKATCRFPDPTTSRPNRLTTSWDAICIVAAIVVPQYKISRRALLRRLLLSLPSRSSSLSNIALWFTRSRRLSIIGTFFYGLFSHFTFFLALGSRMCACFRVLWYSAQNFPRNCTACDHEFRVVGCPRVVCFLAGCSASRNSYLP